MDIANAIKLLGVIVGIIHGSLQIKKTYYRKEEDGRQTTDPNDRSINPSIV